MKINPDHYTTMYECIQYAREHDIRMMKLELDSEGLTDKRVRWDILRHTLIEGKPGITWICDNLYSYLDDSHIDTALRSITGLSD